MSTRRRMKEYLILGHENPDVDSIMSGYLLEQLLKRKGYQASFVIPDTRVEMDTKKICEDYGIIISNYQKELVENKDYILVDHHQREVPGKIVAIFDHHPTNQTFQESYYLNTKIASTALLIYELEPNLFTDEEKKFVVIASIMDTLGFRVIDKFNQSEKKTVLLLCDSLKLDYQEIENQSLQVTALNPIHLAYQNGLKKYNYGNKTVVSSYIQVRKITKKEIEELLCFCQKFLLENQFHMYVFLIHDFYHNQTTVYYLTKERKTCECYNFIASRGSVIMPKVEKYFMNRQQK